MTKSNAFCILAPGVVGLRLLERGKERPELSAAAPLMFASVTGR